MRRPRVRLPELPARFRGQFWDVEFRRQLPRTHPEFVVERLLEHGGDDAVRWLLRNVPRPFLEHVVRRARGLRPPTAYCWANYLGIPLTELACLEKPSPLRNSSFA